MTRGTPCVVLLLFLSLGVATASVTPLALPGENAPAVVLWTAEASYANEPLADARLDQPVQFWRTAIPMAEVATAIKEQTAVELLFWPPEDQNREIRVNLYLNPKSPPPLRDLLAQLAWVLDCSLACTEGESRTYYLLGTDAGNGVMGKLREEQKAQQDEVRRQLLEERRRPLARLEDYRAALDLSPEEAIAAYRGTDDFLLLTVLDPARRAATCFALTLSPEALDNVASSGLVHYRWEELTPDQQRHLAAALAVTPDSLKQEDVTVTVSLWGNGSQPDGLAVGYDWKNPSGSHEPPRRPSQKTLAVADVPMMGPDRCDLKRLLGEPLDAQEESAAGYREMDAREVGRLAAREEQWRKKALASRVLSPAASKQLEDATIPWNGELPYSLWQVQEAAAVLTGKHAVSDCFGDDSGAWRYLSVVDRTYAAAVTARRKRVQEWDEAHPEEMQRWRRERGQQPAERKQLLDAAPPPLSLLTWLTSLCYSQLTRGSVLDSDGRADGSEWGDAGDFLRFRRRFRDVWRAAQVPASALQHVDAATAPYLEAALSFETPPASVHLQFDVSTLSAISRALPPSEDRELQLKDGRSFLLEDPTTPRGSYTNRLRTACLGVVSYLDIYLALIASLSPKQLNLLTGQGLPWASLSPAQRALPLAKSCVRISQSAKPPWSIEKASLHLVPRRYDTKDSIKDFPLQGNVLTSYFLSLRVQGRERHSSMLENTGRADLDLPRHLVEIPGLTSAEEAGKP